MAQSGHTLDDLAARHVGLDVIDTQVKPDCGGASSVPPGNFVEPEIKGTSWESKTVGTLLYRLTGLLVLQNLYSTTVDENHGLKAQIMKLEKLCCQLKEQLKSCTEDSVGSSGVSERDGMSGAVGVEDGEYRGDGDHRVSLLSPLFKTMQVRVTQLEKMMSETEGTTGKGLVKVGFYLLANNLLLV